MRDPDQTVDIKQMIPIIERRTALLIEAAYRVGDAISAGAQPDQINRLRHQVFEALIRLCESSQQDIRGELQEELRAEMDDILWKQNAKPN